ncbi:MAG: DUF1573 domain-containing protein [Sedimentisphaerales bacterium]|nr:DUF1573 domain-containing protein [Sedimentisphaerales bacterium]
MRQLWIKTIIICCAFFVLFGCQEPQKPVNTIKTPEANASAPNTLPPVIEFEETELDFGLVGPGTSCEKEIKFKNTGKGILKINEIILCCGVMASTDKEQYEPNETGILKIEFQAPGAIGTFERQPIVYTNDPVNPQITINIFCDVVQKVVWEPEKIKLLLNEENAACPDLTIKCIDGQEFAITGIRATGNCVTADYNPTIKKTEHVLDLKVDMEKLPEQMYGEISVKMNHPEGNIATIFFDVVPKYTLSPKPLYFHRMKANEPKKETIKIINNYKDDIEIESTSSKEKCVKLIEYKKNGFDYELEVEMTLPPAAEDAIKFVDIFYINLTNGEQLAVTCTGYYE